MPNATSGWMPTTTVAAPRSFAVYAMDRSVRVANESSTEITLVADVRYQCFLSYGGDGPAESQLRGMGVRFVDLVAADRAVAADRIEAVKTREATRL